MQSLADVGTRGLHPRGEFRLRDAQLLHPKKQAPQEHLPVSIHCPHNAAYCIIYDNAVASVSMESSMGCIINGGCPHHRNCCSLGRGGCVGRAKEREAFIRAASSDCETPLSFIQRSRLFWNVCPYQFTIHITLHIE